MTTSSWRGAGTVGARSAGSAKQALAAELSALRARVPGVTNQVLARRAQALAPPGARWTVDDKRLGDWLAGVHVPRDPEALLAVVTVVAEHLELAAGRDGADAPDPTERRPALGSCGLTAAEQRQWRAMWQAARVRDGRAPAPDGKEGPSPGDGDVPAATADAATTGGQGENPLLWVSVDPDEPVCEHADALATRMLATVSRAAGDLNLLVPAPMVLPSRSPDLGVAEPALFPALPYIVHAGVAPTGTRRRLFEAYSGAGGGRLVVTGPPGSGKTASGLLLVLDALAARAALPAPQRASVPVPVVLSAPSWDVLSVTLEDWVADEIAASWSGAGVPERRRQARELLERGLVSLVLDGVDEVRPELRADVIRSAVRSTRCRVVLLGRSGVLQHDLRHLTLGVRVIELLPLSRADVTAYLRSCLPTSPPEAVEGLVREATPADTAGTVRGLSRPLGVALLRDILVDRQAGVPPLTGRGLDGLLTSAVVTRVFPPGRGVDARTARAVLHRLAQGLRQHQVHQFDLRTLPSLLLPAEPLALTVAMVLTTLLAALRAAQILLHRAAGSTSLHMTADCLTFSPEGRAVYDVMLALFVPPLLGAAAGWAVHLWLRVLGPRLPGPAAAAGAAASGRLRGRVRRVGVAGAGGALLGAALCTVVLLLMSAAFELARQWVAVTECTVFATPALLPGLGRQVVWAAALAASGGALLAATQGPGGEDPGRQRAHQDAVVHRAASVLWRVSAPAAVIASVAVVVVGSLTTAAADVGVFVPRTDLGRDAVALVAAADGVLVGMDLGLSMAVVMVPPALLLMQRFPRPGAAGAHQLPAALLAAGVCVVSVLLLVQRRDGAVEPFWVFAALLVAASAHHAASRGSRSLRHGEASSPSGRGAGRSALLLLMVALAVPVTDAIRPAGPPPGRLTEQVAVLDTAVDVQLALTTLVLALSAAATVRCLSAAGPGVRLVGWYLGRQLGGRVDLEATIRQAAAGGLLWRVGDTYRFRHAEIVDWLAGPAGGPGAGTGHAGELTGRPAVRAPG
jgi:hypothetical protein